MYWTPLAAAKRAAEWLDDLGIRTVVDIGSGVGKFCVAGALLGKCRFIGLEQYASLVTSARELVDLFDLNDRVSFVAGTLGVVPTPVGEAYYFFNPFGDYWFGSDDFSQASADFTHSGHADAVAAAEELLRFVPVGTCVLTYNGFGGRVPAGYELIRVDWELRGVLRLWRKQRDTARIGTRRSMNAQSRDRLALASKSANGDLAARGRQVRVPAGASQPVPAPMTASMHSRAIKTTRSMGRGSEEQE